RHSSIATAEATLANLGVSSGLYTTEFCRTGADVKTRLTPAGLASIDAVFFANTTGNLGIPDMAAFLAWIADGHGFLGTHTACDTHPEAPENRRARCAAYGAAPTARPSRRRPGGPTPPSRRSRISARASGSPTSSIASREAA